MTFPALVPTLRPFSLMVFRQKCSPSTCHYFKCCTLLNVSHEMYRQLLYGVESHMSKLHHFSTFCRRMMMKMMMSEHLAFFYSSVVSFGCFACLSRRCGNNKRKPQLKWGKCINNRVCVFVLLQPLEQQRVVRRG